MTVERVGPHESILRILEVTNSYNSDGNSSTGSNILDLFVACDDLRKNESTFYNAISLSFEKLGRNSLNLIFDYDFVGIYIPGDGINYPWSSGTGLFIDYLRPGNFFFFAICIS